MDRNLENEYKEYMSSDMPDLWSRIEKGIETPEERPVKKIRSFRRFVAIGMPIAAAVAVFVFVASIFNSFVHLGGAKNSSEAMAEAAAPAAEAPAAAAEACAEAEEAVTEDYDAYMEAEEAEAEDITEGVESATFNKDNSVAAEAPAAEADGGAFEDLGYSKLENAKLEDISVYDNDGYYTRLIFKETDHEGNKVSSYVYVTKELYDELETVGIVPEVGSRYSLECIKIEKPEHEGPVVLRGDAGPKFYELKTIKQ